MLIFPSISRQNEYKYSVGVIHFHIRLSLNFPQENENKHIPPYF